MQFETKQAFSLIELMVVVAIVAVLGSFALPAYQEYILRTRVVEGLTLARTAQLSVESNAMSGIPYSSGYTKPLPTKYVSDITISSWGMITITYSGTPQLDGKTILLYPKDQQPLPSGGACVKDLTPSAIPIGIISWTCRSAGTPDGSTKGTVPANLVPDSCRGSHFNASFTSCP